MRHAARILTTHLATALAALACSATASAHQANPTCPSVHKPAVQEAMAKLGRDQDLLDIRLRLADTFIQDGCFDDALHLLEEGESLHPRSNEIQTRLRTTRSMLSEQQYFEGLDRAEQAAKLSRLLLRCSKLGDLAACDEGIALKPQDPELAIAKGDALMQGKRSAEALTVYRRAAELTPSNETLASKIAAAQTQRQAAFTACQTESGDTALRACDAALIRGLEDEFSIHKRRAILLQAANQPAPALDAYIAANVLKQGDRSVALGIVALSDSTARKDALTLAAKGSALLTLGRATDAVPALRQALTLAPGLQETKAQLAKAERLAVAEARRLAAAKAADQQKQPAASESTPAKRYSNTAPPTQSN